MLVVETLANSTVDHIGEKKLLIWHPSSVGEKKCWRMSSTFVMHRFSKTPYFNSKINYIHVQV